MTLLTASNSNDVFQGVRPRPCKFHNVAEICQLILQAHTRNQAPWGNRWGKIFHRGNSNFPGEITRESFPRENFYLGKFTPATDQGNLEKLCKL